MNFNNQPNKPKRKKIYYPSSTIRPNLFTKGGELMTEDNEEYIGFYHVYDSGEIFSESDWDEEKSKKLLLIDNKLVKIKDISIKKVLKNLEYTKGINVSKFIHPVEYNLIPTQEDYDNGYIIRYFIGKVNDVNYPLMEVDKEVFESIGDEKGIDNLLFKGVKLEWSLTGPLNDEYDSDGNIKKSGVYDTNLRLINHYNKEIPNLNKYLTNPIEYSIYSKYYSTNIK